MYKSSVFKCNCTSQTIAGITFYTTDQLYTWIESHKNIEGKIIEVYIQNSKSWRYKSKKRIFILSSNNRQRIKMARNSDN